MAKPVESIKHPNDKRPRIPSKEEAGYEDASPKVQQGKKTLELPKNPVVHRGQDPELFWLNKYGPTDHDDQLNVDIRSLYRHEHISPEVLISALHRTTGPPTIQGSLFATETYGQDELEKIGQYYQHQDGWTNRLVQGDSHLVMASLLEREGMAGQVQMVYLDPPYGIKYGSNWQIKLNNRDVKDGADESLAAEPEVIKAFRDTWELGIHSYLGYLRDRLLLAKELLADTGSCFVQISDENVHLVRCLMDEVFGSGNFVSQISFQKTGGIEAVLLGTTADYILWYSKEKRLVKYNQLYIFRQIGDASLDRYDMLLKDDNTTRRLKPEEIKNGILEDNGKRYQLAPLYSDGASSQQQEFVFGGKSYFPRKDTHWKTTVSGLHKLANLKRIEVMGTTIRYRRFVDDFPVIPITDRWDSMQLGIERSYVVQTASSVIQRCLLMTTDPGDLVLDPTCGSGTTAYVAEQWGRRWITIDTSRIALSIAKQRLMTAVYPYYKLHDEPSGDIRQGFIYKTVPHITLKSLANDEPPATETLYDKPETDPKKLRVSGPFTVETLQNFEPLAPEQLQEVGPPADDPTTFAETVKQHLLSAGVKNGRKNEQVVFARIEPLGHPYLHAEGFYQNGTGEKKAYLHLGPKFGTVSKAAVNEAIIECRRRGDAQWLIILGFSFESDIESSSQTTSLGKFEVTKARIHDDLLQDGLKKKPGRGAASFVTIGEPDVALHRQGSTVTVEIQGLDIYDPIHDEVKARNVSDIAYWMVDDHYDGSNFIVRQVFFCGGDKGEFDKWKKGLENLARDSTKKKAEKTLKIEIDEEAFDRLYGHVSHPIEITKPGQKIAVRVISQFGEETTKVLVV
jgi:adenine-specific DNA-methyltransferase